MNTKMIYNTNIKVAVPGTQISCIVNVHFKEKEFVALHEQLETKRFISVVDSKQNPVTINVSNIYKIDANIEIVSDTKIEEED